MSTKSRQSIYGGRVMGAKIRAKHAREEATKALREADRAEAEAWSIRMEGYGGPAQPSPTIGQCLNGGLGWLEVECNRCKTRGEPAARCHPPPERHSALEARGLVEMPLMPQGTSSCAAGAHDQADGNARAHALRLGTPRRRPVTPGNFSSASSGFFT
jgi:hypothetical protein